MEPLDLRKLKCPMPALLARKAMAVMPVGTQVLVLADDPMAVVDIPHMCHQEGHAVEKISTTDGVSEFRLCVRPGSWAPTLHPEQAAPHPDPDG